MSIKLIVALDFDNLPDARKLVDQLDPNSCALKVGSEMFTLFGTEFVRGLIDRKFKVFLDLKYHDIPNTVARACVAAAEIGIWMLNVHASGGLAMMQAASRALESYGSARPLLIAVTVLTSMRSDDLYATGVHASLERHVCDLACLAKEAGLDGVVCSALEVPEVKAACGQNFLTITPGIRLPGNPQDDQARIITPARAFKAGSDYLVIGRPITRADEPATVIREILAMKN